MKRWIVLLIAVAAAAWAWSAFRPVKLVNDPPPAGPIVAFGDSLTFGTGAGPAESYPARLAKLLGRPVVNGGVPGDTVAMAAARLDKDVLKRKPGLVIVLIGGNDLLQRRDMDAAFAGIEQMVRKIQQTGALVAVAAIDGVFPLSGLNRRYRALARKTGALFIPDVLDGILGDRQFMSDQVHPNAAGYALVAKAIAGAIQGHLPPA